MLTCDTEWTHEILQYQNSEHVACGQQRHWVKPPIEILVLLAP